MGERRIQFIVGTFMLAGALALTILAFRVSGLTSYAAHGSYVVTADFSNVAGLKVRAPVKMAGVRIGEIAGITLDKKTYHAIVSLRLDGQENTIPSDSSASILTAGLLGARYVSLNPGFENSFLKEGDNITETHPALILENLIGQLLFKIKGDKQ